MYSLESIRQLLRIFVPLHRRRYRLVCGRELLVLFSLQHQYGLSYKMAPPFPPAPLHPMVSIAVGVADSKKPINEIGVGFPNVERSFPAFGVLGLRYSFSKTSRGIGSITLSVV